MGAWSAHSSVRPQPWVPGARTRRSSPSLGCRGDRCAHATSPPPLCGDHKPGPQVTTWNSCPGGPPDTLRPCRQPSPLLPDDWGFRANLFYCSCLHLAKGDSNPGAGQASRPHPFESGLGASPSGSPQLCLLLPSAPHPFPAAHTPFLPSNNTRQTPICPAKPPPPGRLPAPRGWELQEHRARVSHPEREGVQQEMSACTAGYTWRACAGGVHVRRPQGRPLFRPGPASAVKPGLRLPPPSLQTRGERGGAACASGLAHPAPRGPSPAPMGQPRAIGPSGRPKGGPANETSRGAGGARARPGAGGGGQGALPEVTSGGSRGALPRQPRFHLSAFPGGRPLPFSFFLNGVLWGGEAEGSEGPTPPLCDLGRPCRLSLGLPLLPCLAHGGRGGVGGPPRRGHRDRPPLRLLLARGRAGCAKHGPGTTHGAGTTRGCRRRRGRDLRVPGTHHRPQGPPGAPGSGTWLAAQAPLAAPPGLPGRAGSSFPPSPRSRGLRRPQPLSPVTVNSPGIGPDIRLPGVGVGRFGVTGRREGREALRTRPGPPWRPHLPPSRRGPGAGSHPSGGPQFPGRYSGSFTKKGRAR